MAEEVAPKGLFPIRIRPPTNMRRPALAVGAAQEVLQQPTDSNMVPPCPCQCPALRANHYFSEDHITMDCFANLQMSPPPPPPHGPGLFCKLTNTYCLVADGLTRNNYRQIESKLPDGSPIFKTTLCNSSFVGPLCVGNRNGLILSCNTTDRELRYIRNCVPDEVVVQRLGERPFDLGRFIACNDSLALVSTDLSRETVEIIEAVLCVDTIKLTVAGSNLVGSFTIFNNLGGMVHHLSSDEEMDELSMLFERPLAAGTVNCGSEDIGFGMVVNDSGAIYGSNTTARELCVIESVFKPRGTLNSAIVDECYFHGLS